jgi:hypothetical protein
MPQKSDDHIRATDSAAKDTNKQVNNVSSGVGAAAGSNAAMTRNVQESNIEAANDVKAKAEKPSDIKVKDDATPTDLETRLNELIDELGEDEEAIYEALLDEGYTEEELEALNLGEEIGSEEDTDANGVPDIDDLDDEDKQVVREIYGAIFPGDPGYPDNGTDETSTFSGEASSGNPLAKLLGGLKF